MTAPPDPLAAAESARALADLNRWLARQSAEGRVAWALENTAGEHALSSSFGAQAAVSLHLVTRQKAGIPVILVDTGYLFPETYRFADELAEKLDLNLKVYRARSEEHTSELQSLMRISYAVFCLKKQHTTINNN